jgi:methyl-accepting chemotaxis protein
MFRSQPSIRSKVNYAYYFGIILVIIVAFLNYFNLTRLNRKVEFGFVISELFDTALEIRRYEKNYFLYGHKEDYLENLRFIERAEEIINRNREAIEKLVIKSQIYALDADIKDYKSLIQRHFDLKQGHADPLTISEIEGRIRQKGKEIIEAAETISASERRYIQSLIGLSQKILIGSGVFLVIIGFIIAEYLYRMVIKPLKQLEDSMQKISSGEFSFMPALSRDKEMVSLVEALNRMLKELEIRQKRLIAQSEKLASLEPWHQA